MNFATEPDDKPIPKQFAHDTCKLGMMADCCRYLAADKFGLCCLKGTGLQAELDQRAAAGQMNARADNCEGWKNRVGRHLTKVTSEDGRPGLL